MSHHEQWEEYVTASEEIQNLRIVNGELLAALKAAKSWMEEYTDPCGEPYNTICAAIEKAST